MKDEMVQTLIDNARVAQKTFESYNQEQVDAVVKAAGKAIFDHADELANLAIEETKMGSLQSKLNKQRNIPRSHWNFLRDKKSVGMIEEDREKNLVTYAKPMGVVACLTPVTNPTSTVVGNGMHAFKSRNAMIVSPHPAAKKCTARAVDIIREALEELGAPADLLQVIRDPSLPRTQQLMADCDITIATGGAAMVKAAYSSGRPSLGVGSGNVQSLVDYHQNEKFDRIAQETIVCITIDNGIQCTTEQCVHVPREDQEELMQKFEEHGAYIVRDKEEADKVREGLFVQREDGSYILNAELIGLEAPEIGRLLDIPVPADRKIIMVPVTETAKTERLCLENLSVVTTCLPYDSFEQGVASAVENLEVQGAGHSSCIFSDKQENIDYYAERIPVARLMVDTAATLAGGNTPLSGYNPTMSLGCGTWGNNALSENTTYVHLMNKTVSSRPISGREWPSDEDLWG